MTAQTTRFDSNDLRAYEFCFEGSAAESYILERGISKETAKRFQLGWDTQQLNTGGVTDLLVIPTSNDSFIFRRLDADCDSASRYRNSPGQTHFFNEAALTNAQSPIFITEGALDALSIIECCGEAVSLNSTANVNRLLRMLEDQKPKQKLIISMDSDEAGKRAEKELAEGLSKLSIPYYIISDWNGCKDANELLIKSRADFEKLISKAMEEQPALNETDREVLELLNQNRMDNCIDDLLTTISERSLAPRISTGFCELDDILGGGIPAGLHVVAAMSSLGKTTLVVQMCASMAQQGQDILFFTLEMSRLELFAKNISRHSFELDVRNHSQTGLSTNDVVSGYAERSGNNSLKAHLQKSIEAYQVYSDKLTVIEGHGDITASKIRELTESYTRLTNRVPVVVIDYIQLLQPADIRMTDKQNMDSSIMELKRLTAQGCPVIAISSLNRASYDTPVTMASLKESGNIEYSAETILALDFQALYDTQRNNSKGFDLNAEKQKPAREVLMTVLKNRNGRVGDQISMLFYPKYNFFQ